MTLQNPIGMILDGRYRLDEIIGAGSIGTVYKATQLTVKRPVAIKVLNASVKHHPKLQQRLEIEARAVGRLNHPNVLTLFDFAYSIDKDLLYMVVEYIEGRTLSTLIKQGLSTAFALRITYQVANALAHAHGAGVSHRDLKPGNVMLAREARGERVKVLDFGLARVRDDAGGKRVTGIGGIQGAPAYISPEQCIGDPDVGSPTDIYSLGCVVFEMLEGKVPFDYHAPGKLMKAHMSEAPPTPTNAEITPQVRMLVHRMLSKEPSDRPTADDVMKALRPYVQLDPSVETLL